MIRAWGKLGAVHELDKPDPASGRHPPEKLSAATEVISWYSWSVSRARRKGRDRLRSNCKRDGERAVLAARGVLEAEKASREQKGAINLP